MHVNTVYNISVTPGDRRVLCSFLNILDNAPMNITADDCVEILRTIAHQVNNPDIDVDGVIEIRYED